MGYWGAGLQGARQPKGAIAICQDALDEYFANE